MGVEQRRDRKMGFVLGVYERGGPGEGGGRRQGGRRGGEVGSTQCSALHSLLVCGLSYKRAITVQ